MANDVAGTVWKLDTAGASTIWTGRIKINEVAWVGHNGGVDAAELTDINDNTIARFDAQNSSDNQRTSYGEGQIVNGLKMPTLSSGNVYVSIK